MLRVLLIRGMLVGVLAGFLAFGFAQIFGEAQVDSAIAFENRMHQSMAMAPEMELVSREVQSTIGLFTGVVVYGTALGGLFALAFAYAHGRVGSLSPRATSALLTAIGFVAIVLVPAMTYPPNPPAVGESDTLVYRTEMYFIMLLISVVAITGAIALGRHLVSSLGIWNAVLAAAAAFLVVIAIVQFLLPTINEVPEHFPAVVLWRFRIASLGLQVVLWTTMGLLFGALTERNLTVRYGLRNPSVS